MKKRLPGSEILTRPATTIISLSARSPARAMYAPAEKSSERVRTSNCRTAEISVFNQSDEMSAEHQLRSGMRVGLVSLSTEMSGRRELQL